MSLCFLAIKPTQLTSRKARPAPIVIALLR